MSAPRGYNGYSARGRGGGRGGHRPASGPFVFVPQVATPAMIEEAEKRGLPTRVIACIGCKGPTSEWHILCENTFDNKDVDGAVFDTREEARIAGYGDEEVYSIGHAREDGKVHVTRLSDEIRAEGGVPLECFPAGHLEPDARAELRQHEKANSPFNSAIYKKAARWVIENETGLTLSESVVRHAMVSPLPVIFGSVKKGTAHLSYFMVVVFIHPRDASGDFPALSGGKQYSIAQAHWLPLAGLKDLPTNNVGHHVRQYISNAWFDSVEAAITSASASSS